MKPRYATPPFAAKNAYPGCFFITLLLKTQPYFDKLYTSLRITVPVVLFLPESFEYLVLRSGLVCDNSDARLTKTYMYAQSECYMSWEQYYTALLQSLMDYSKHTLNPTLLASSNKKAILNTIPVETGLH